MQEQPVPAAPPAIQIKASSMQVPSRRPALRLPAASLFAIAAGLAATVPAPASAQTPPRPPSAGIEEIVVTAQRREENQQDVPISITAISGEKFDNLSAGGVDIRFLSARVPSLIVESSFGRTFPRFYIRGLGNTDFDLNASQPVSLVYDEVVLENPVLKGFPLFDIERVEVLRGPQGTLFGRNTPAGTISFISKKPTDELDGYITASYGRFETVDVEGAVGGPVIDGVLSVRGSFTYQRRDDWVANTFTGEDEALEGYDEVAGRLQLLYDRGGAFSGLFSARVRSLEGTARLFRANRFVPGDDALVPDFRRDEAFINAPNDQELDNIGFTANLSYDLGFATLTAITGYETAEFFSVGDIDGGVAGVGPGFIPFDAQTSDALDDLDQISQEIRLSSNGDGPLSWQGGFFYFSEDVDIGSVSFGNEGNPFNPSRVLVSNQQNRTWAVFGQANYDLTDRWTVTAGLRYSSDDKDYTNVTTLFDPSSQDVTSIQLARSIISVTPAEAETEDGRVSWDVSSSYVLTDGINLYSRIAAGFRAPSIQGRTLFAPGLVTTADSERLRSYEGGIKADLFGNLARLNLNAFYYTIRDQQLTAIGGAANNTILLNAEQGRGTGFEADVEVAPIENLLLTAGLSYNDTEIQDGDLEVAACGAPCTVTDPTRQIPGAFGPVTLASVDGNPFPQAPKWIANWTARYGIPVGADGEVFFFTDWAFRSRINFFLYESAEFQDTRSLEGGIRIGYAQNDGRFEVSAFGRNITNDVSAQGAIDFNNLTGFVNEPPVWGIELGVRF